MRVLDSAEYAKLERPQQEWLVERLIPKPGLAVLLGQSFEGKTFMAMQLALCLVHGESAFLGLPARKARVWYLQLDTSELLWRETLNKLAATGIDISGFSLLHPDDTPVVDIMTTASQAWLRHAIRTIEPDLTIIDVLRELHTSDENDSTTMKRVGDQVMHLWRGRSILLIHHTRKIPPDIEDPDPRYFGRGSSYLAGKADIAAILHKNVLRVRGRGGDVCISLSRQECGFWSRRHIGPKFPTVSDLKNQPALPGGQPISSPSAETQPT